MKKRMLLAVLVVLFGFVLIACEEPVPTVPTDPTVPTEPTDPTTPTLSAITFSGISSSIEDIEFEAVFDVLDGITATGNDGVDYTDQITYNSISTISEEGLLDTTKTGPHAIRYTVQVGTVLAQVWRYLNVKTPERPDDALVVNGDFAQGTAFWDNSENGFFVADGAALTLSTEDGALKAEVVAGSNLWTPRFGQQMVPFEQGKAYKVQFDAKSSVAKTINVQVGELIPNAPWFVDFKPGQTEHHSLTTEWATYEFSFMMNLDNPRGGVLFEMGTLAGQTIDATIWFDNIIVTETEIGEDTVNPSISGVRPVVQLMVDDTFDPLAGVSALDNIDGDLTDAIDVEIFLVEGETETSVEAVDTSMEGNYRIVYTVTDAAGNVATAESTVEIILILVEAYPGWRAFLNDWEGTAGELVVSNGELNLNLTAINASAGWNIQVIQDGTSLYGMPDNTGSINFVAGETYRVTFDAKATVAGDIKLAIGHAGGGWTPYFESAMTAITTEMATYTFTFTLDNAEADYTVPAQFKIEMGTLFAGQTAPQSFTLDNVKIEVEEGEAFVATDLIFNGTMDDQPVLNTYALPEWRAFANTWEGGAATIEGQDGVLAFIATGINAYQSWTMQVIQDATALTGAPDNTGHMAMVAGKTYRVTFDAKATMPGDIKLAIGHGTDGWVPYFESEMTPITADWATYTFTFTLDNAEADYSVAAQFKIELGNLLNGKTAPQTFYLDNVLIEVMEGEVYVDAMLIENGTMDGEVLEAPAWVGYGLTAESTVANVTITYADTPAQWWNNNAQLPIADFDGTKNAVKFVFTGEVGHDYLFKIEGGGQAVELALVGDGTEQELVLPLNTLTEAQRDGLNLIIVFVRTVGASGTVVVNHFEYDMVAETPAEPEWVSQGITAVEGEGNVTFTYADTPANWWEKNSNITVYDFDGTKTSIEFTFTGVATHVYVFKVEGTGVAFEATVTATGAEQTFVLDLSSLTEVQRDAIAKVVFFVQTTGAAGTAVVNDWVYGS